MEKKEKTSALTFMSCDLNFSLFMDLTAFFSSSRLMYSFSPSDSGLPEETQTSVQYLSTSPDASVQPVYVYT